MPIDGVTGAAAAPAPATGAGEQLGQLNGDMFLKLLVAQLRYQNPMQPTDASAMLQQTAQFTQVETLKQLAESQKALLGSQQTALAASYVGKEVTALDADGQSVTGVVDALRFTEDGPLLRIGELELPLDAALEIRLPDQTGTNSSSV